MKKRERGDERELEREMSVTKRRKFTLLFQFSVGIVTGTANPRVSTAGWLGVGVRVEEFIPQQNPYPHHGYRGISDLFYFQFFCSYIYIYL